MSSRHEGMKNIEVEIRRIDYGDSTCLSLWNIKELCGEVAKIPAQALQVCLADVGAILFHIVISFVFFKLYYL